MVPPRRALASSKVIPTGTPRAGAAWIRRYTAVRPVMPPPITMTRFVAPTLSTRLAPQPSATTQTLGQQLAQHCEERRVRAHRGRAHIGQAAGQRGVAGLDIEIVEHLDVVTQKSNRSYNDIVIAFSLHLGDGVINVRLEPRKRCARGLTLIGQTVVLMP